MIRDAASSSRCSGASAGGSGFPSDGSPQIQPACPRSGPHAAAAGSPAPADSVSVTPPVFTPSYFHVKSFDLKVSPPWANSRPQVVVPMRWGSHRLRVRDGTGLGDPDFG